MTVSQAKKIVKEWLEKNNLSYTKLRGKTIYFFGKRTIFIFISGFNYKNNKFEELEKIAYKNNFYVQHEEIYVF